MEMLRRKFLQGVAALLAAPILKVGEPFSEPDFHGWSRAQASDAMNASLQLASPAQQGNVIIGSIYVPDSSPGTIKLTDNTGAEYQLLSHENDVSMFFRVIDSDDVNAFTVSGAEDCNLMAVDEWRPPLGTKSLSLDGASSGVIVSTFPPESK